MPDTWIIHTCPLCANAAGTLPQRFSGAGYRIGTRISCGGGAVFDPYRDMPRINRGMVYLGACLIAGIRLAREKQVNVRVVPTSHAIHESVDLAVLQPSIADRLLNARTYVQAAKSKRLSMN